MTGATGVPPEPEEHSPRWPSPTTNDQALTLELLVHGMGEVPPETSLQDPHVFLYSGGERAGTYRRWGDQDAEDHPEIYTGGCVSEAYASVSNSSYRRQRALGLVALPFLLVNLSHWMVSPSVRNRWAYEILVRLAALCLTMLLALTACEIALDLVAWQCAGDGSCSAAHSWLVFPFGEDVGRWGQPGRRLAVAALAPTVALVLLAAPSLRVSDWYLRPATPHGHAEVGASALEQRDFWCRWQTSSRRLGRAHLAMGLAVVGWAVLEPMLRYDRSHSESLAVLDWALLVMLSVTALWAVAEVVGTDAGRESTGGRPGFPLGRELPKAALAVLATTLAVATMSRPGWHTNGGLPGFTSDFAVVGALAGLVLVLLFALPQGLEKPTPGTPDSGFSGPSTLVLPSLTGPATAALAVGLGVQLSAGVCVATARWLASGDGLPKPPSLLAWLCAAVVVTLLAAMVPACLRLIQRLRRRGVLIAAVRNSYGVLEGKKVGPNTLRLVLALEAARETEFTPTVLGVLAVLTTATSVAAEGAGLDTHTTPSGAAASQGDGLLADVAQATTATGSWLTVGFVLVLIGLGLEAGRSLGLQRMAALILDVSAFWPRAAAPFAPPCYAETAVTDLEWRTRAWLETDPRRAMVFSAHGHGSVLAAATLWRLDPPDRARVALFTYGSPLRRVYSRFFPAYFGPDHLARLHRDTSGWRNLYRLTDPLGGPVRVPASGDKPAPDVLDVLDPPLLDRHQQQPAAPTAQAEDPQPLAQLEGIQAGQNYPLAPSFDRTRRLVLTLISTGRTPQEPGAVTVDRQPKAWLEASRHPPAVGDHLTLGFEIGRPLDLADLDPLDPGWHGSDSVDLLVLVSCDSAVVRPSGSVLALPRAGSTKELTFTVVPDVEGDLTIRIEVRHGRRGSLLQKLEAHLDIAPARRKGFK